MGILSRLSKPDSASAGRTFGFAWRCGGDSVLCSFKRMLLRDEKGLLHDEKELLHDEKELVFSQKSGHFNQMRWISLIFALFGVFFPISAQSQTTSAEYKLKAAFLYNFVQFVDWPERAFENENSPLVIGVLGADPFGTSLDEIAEGDVIKGRKLTVRRYKSVKDIKDCHVLFICASEQSKIKSIIAGLKGRSILTVGDVDGFTTEWGGMVRFLTEKNKIRFRINLEAAKAEEISISSKLLQLAEIVPVAEQRP